LPFSYILKNEGTVKFAERKRNSADMVTDSKWADINTNNQLKIIIVDD
jgi:hypothetical protein